MKKYISPRMDVTKIFDVISISGPTIDGKSSSFVPNQSDSPTPSVDGNNTEFNPNW